MLLSWFRSSSPISILLFSIYLLMMQWGLLIPPTSLAYHQISPFSEWLLSSVLSQDVLLKLCYIVVCVYIAVIVNLSLNKLKLSTFENSHFGASSVLFISIYSSHVLDLEMMIALALLSHALLKLLTIDAHIGPVKVIYDIGFLVGIASLFIMPIIYLLPAFLIGISILRPFNIKEIILLLTGAVSVYFFAFAIMFWQGQHIEQLHLHFASIYQFRDLVIPQSYWGVVGSGGAFLFWAALVILRRYRNLAIMIRNQISVLIWFSIFGIVITYFHFNINSGLLSILTIPSVYVLVLAMNETKQWKVVEAIHLLILCGVIYQQYLIFAN